MATKSETKVARLTAGLKNLSTAMKEKKTEWDKLVSGDMPETNYSRKLIKKFINDYRALIEDVREVLKKIREEKFELPPEFQTLIKELNSTLHEVPTIKNRSVSDTSMQTIELADLVIAEASHKLKIPEEAPLLPLASAAPKFDALQVVNDAYAQSGSPVVAAVTTPRRNSWDELTALATITAKMEKFERDKYPPTKFQFERIHLSNGQQIIAVSSKGEKLTTSERNHMKSHTLALRKLSLIAGVMYMLNESPSFMATDPAQKQAVINKLTELANTIDETEDQSLDSINKFFDHLVGDIHSVLTPKPSHEFVVRNIRNAERYFVAEYSQGKIVANETRMDGQAFVQLDIPVGNQLSDAQKQEYMRIHDVNNLPKWFLALPQWERDWFVNKVPATLSDQRWEKFTALFISANMQHIPGVKNARMNYLYQQSDQGLKKLSTSLKMSTLDPYEMPDSEKAKICKMNAEQVLPMLSSGSDRLIMFNSLLSDVNIMSIEDGTMVQSQTKALGSTEVAGKATIAVGNDSTNLTRMLVPFTREPRFLTRWAHIDKIMDYYEKNKASQGFEQNPLIQEAVSNLRDLRRKFHPFALFSKRNFNAHKAAYAGILVEAMGGMVSTNCKSGKDRTGLDELYRAAMRIYFERYHRLPHIDDNAEERKKFVDIFVTLFNSLKIQEAAAFNSPGAFGIIDNARVLSGDIRKALGKDYGASIGIGNLNKGKAARRDEAAAVKERKSQDKRPEEKLVAEAPLAKSIAIPLPPPKYDANNQLYYGETAAVTSTKEEAVKQVQEHLQTSAPMPATGSVTIASSQNTADQQFRYVNHDIVDPLHQVHIRGGSVQSSDPTLKTCRADFYFDDVSKFNAIPRKSDSVAFIPRVSIPGLLIMQWAIAKVSELKEQNGLNYALKFEPGPSSKMILPKVGIEALQLAAKLLQQEMEPSKGISVSQKQLDYLRHLAQTEWRGKLFAAPAAAPTPQPQAGPTI